MRTVRAVFKRSADGKAARDRLIATGIPPQRVSVVGGSSAGASVPASRALERSPWGNMRDMLFGEERPATGAPADHGSVLTASVEDEMLEGVIALLSKSGRVDFAEDPEEDLQDADRGTNLVAIPSLHDRVRLSSYRAAWNGCDVTAVDDALFGERSFEFVETQDEVAIVRDARIREEVIIRRSVVERIRPIDGMTRSTHADVETAS
ncbi:hypothetical protein [Allosphingosinicella deserti]|uniref:DUF2382 domain-containing protein n=1 Tax=Allosphingosinicella deserti TaxID=2116704 RepID=A0A2P7QJC3_9SPHN|nr:hypothetical protein [Sphingomonas deserti]PSJ38075.1 hypothetical protein C7I55_20540 [Sphingomonas deserti]